MNLRIGVGVVAIAAMTVACKKSPEGGSGSTSASGSAAVAGGSGSTAGSSAAGPGSATAASSSGSGGVAAGSGSAGSAAAGSAAGSATGSGSGTAASGGDGAATYNKAAFLADPLCMQVADKIRECASKPEFVAALDGGAAAPQKKINARLRKGVKKWQSSYELCHNAWDILNYEYTGFLDKPAVFKAPDALSSCAALGAAVKAGGGLVGGKTAD
jgi:hypothetical protein